MIPITHSIETPTNPIFQIIAERLQNQKRIFHQPSHSPPALHIMRTTFNPDQHLVDCSVHLRPDSIGISVFGKTSSATFPLSDPEALDKIINHITAALTKTP